jgi:hypothetical protein
MPIRLWVVATVDIAGRARGLGRRSAFLAVAVAVLGCGGQALTLPTPAPSPVVGLDWGRAAHVPKPSEGFALPSPGTSFGNTDGVNRLGHPLHFSGQAAMADVVDRPSGGFVAVGSVYPGWHPVAWTSGDGQTWQIESMGETAFTFPVALAVGSDGGIVAVGRSGSSPVAWTSTDGFVWKEHLVPTLGAVVAERMTTVIATTGGYLAGGSVGPELADRHARFWRSTDGATWEPIADDADAFANAEVRAIVAVGDGFIAIGTVGTVQHITGSVAWTSPDGQKWTRVDAPSLTAGRAVAIVAAPFSGVVAAGSDLGGHEALAWVSVDGRTWTLAPSEPSRQFHGSILMTDLAVQGGAVIGVGKYAPLQRSTAVSWVTRDGLHWEEGRTSAVQEQAEFDAVTAGGPGLVAVGSFGGPDDVIPVVWLSPAR